MTDNTHINDTDDFQVVSSKKKKPVEENSKKGIFAFDPEGYKMDKASLVADMYLNMTDWCKLNALPLLDKCETIDLLDFVFGFDDDTSEDASE